MNYLKQALMELLSGLTIKKNEKEIWTKNNYGFDITVEPIDDGCYILRRYWINGQLFWEHRLKNDQRHGISKWWYKDGQPRWEYQFKNNKQHGICKGWNSEGKVMYEVLWENGKLVKTII